jgi:hypothetical protein
VLGETRIAGILGNEVSKYGKSGSLVSYRRHTTYRKSTREYVIGGEMNRAINN